MTYCKNTDGNLAALARHEAEQDLLRDDGRKRQLRIEKEGFELMLGCKPILNDVAFEAITESEDASEAICDLIRNYHVKGNTERNNKLVADFLEAVQTYVKDYVEGDV